MSGGDGVPNSKRAFPQFLLVVGCCKVLVTWWLISPHTHTKWMIQENKEEAIMSRIRSDISLLLQHSIPEKWVTKTFPHLMGQSILDSTFWGEECHNIFGLILKPPQSRGWGDKPWCWCSEQQVIMKTLVYTIAVCRGCIARGKS